MNRSLWMNEEIGISNEGSLPKIEGEFRASLMVYSVKQLTTGAFTNNVIGSNSKGASGHPFNEYNFTFDASKFKTAYSRDDNCVVPTAINILFCIKY